MKITKKKIAADINAAIKAYGLAVTGISRAELISDDYGSLDCSTEEFKDMVESGNYSVELLRYIWWKEVTITSGLIATMFNDIYISEAQLKRMANAIKFHYDTIMKLNTQK